MADTVLYRIRKKSSNWDIAECAVHNGSLHFMLCSNTDGAVWLAEDEVRLIEKKRFDYAAAGYRTLYDHIGLFTDLYVKNRAVKIMGILTPETVSIIRKRGLIFPNVYNGHNPEKDCVFLDGVARRRNCTPSELKKLGGIFSSSGQLMPALKEMFRKDNRDFILSRLEKLSN